MQRPGVPEFQRPFSFSAHGGQEVAARSVHVDLLSLAHPVVPRVVTDYGLDAAAWLKETRAVSAAQPRVMLEPETIFAARGGGGVQRAAVGEGAELGGFRGAPEECHGHGDEARNQAREGKAVSWGGAGHVAPSLVRRAGRLGQRARVQRQSG